MRFSHLEFFSWRVICSHGGGGYLQLVTSERSILTIRWTLQLVSTSYSIFGKSRAFVPFLLPRLNIRVDFLTLQAKFWKSFRQILENGCWKHNVLFWSFFIFFDFQDGVVSHFASRPFPISVFSASCILARRPIVACYACSFVIYHRPFWYALDCF